MADWLMVNVALEADNMGNSAKNDYLLAQESRGQDSKLTPFGFSKAALTP